MKFGRRLLEESDPRYRHFYIAYKDLKQAIKLITGSDATSFSISQVTHNFGNLPALAGSVFRPPESRFQDLLNHEKEKINKFMEVNLTATISALKQLLKDLLREDPSDEGYYDDCNLPLREIDQQAEMIIFLKSYQTINRIGFRKITKKYDKHNQSNSSHWYLAQLQRESFINADFNTPLKLLSLCYQIVLARQNTCFGKENLLMSGSINYATNPPAGGGGRAPQPPVVVSTYLFKLEDAVKVKVMLAKCLPLITLGTCCFVGREAVDVLINPLAAILPTSTTSMGASKSKKTRSVDEAKYSHGSLYFDNRQFSAIRSVLNGPVCDHPEERVLRVRWFGVHDGENDKDVYVERLPLNELHLGLRQESVDLLSEDFTMSSEKPVVMIKTKHLNSMLTSSFDLDSWIRRKGIAAEHVEMVRSLLGELQTQLSAGDILPVLQVWSYRTTFTLAQEEQDVVVEAFVDENLCNVSQLTITGDKIELPAAAVGAGDSTCLTPYTQLRSEGLVCEDQFCTLTLTYPQGYAFPYPLNQPKIDEGDTESRRSGHGDDGLKIFDSALTELSMDQFIAALTVMGSMYQVSHFSHFAHAAASLFGHLKSLRLIKPTWFKSTLVAGSIDDLEDEDDAADQRSHHRRHISASSNQQLFSSANRRSSGRLIGDDLLGSASVSLGGGAAANAVAGGGYHSAGAAMLHTTGPAELLPAPKYLDQPTGEQRGGFLRLDATSIPVQEEPVSGLREPLLNEARRVRRVSKLAKLYVAGKDWWQRVTAPEPTVATTVRVEPKTFFANERTLLQWLNIAVLLSTISITLITVGSRESRLAGFILAPIAIYFILHSYATYLRRTRALINKDPIDYVDHRGPLVLVWSLVFAMLAILAINIFMPQKAPPAPPVA